MIKTESSALSSEKIEYVHSPRAKRLWLTVRPPGLVRVSVPKGCSIARARKFVRLKQAWIRKALKDIEKVGPPCTVPPPVDAQMIARQHTLLTRLGELAQQHGFSYRRVGIRNQKTRWGSCSARNNISLNIRLLRLPEHLRDYVILHELVHTEHKNHSKAFWARLDELLGGRAGRLRKELRKYSITTIM